MPDAGRETSPPTPPALTALIADGVLDADLGALLCVLAEHGVPLVVAADEAASAQSLRGSVADLLPVDRRSTDVRLPGGVVAGSSLEDVLRLLGGRPGDDLPDDARDLGIVVIVTDGRVASGHYVRPVERDGAGHLQRRPPAVLSARDRDSGGLDHFHWGISDELATRAGITRVEFEDSHAARARLLDDLAVAGVRDAGGLRRHVEQAALSIPVGAAKRDDAPN